MAQEQVNPEDSLFCIALHSPPPEKKSALYRQRTYELRSLMVIRIEPVLGQLANVAAFPCRAAARHPMTLKSQPACAEVLLVNIAFFFSKSCNLYLTLYIFHNLCEALRFHHNTELNAMNTHVMNTFGNR
jgi:hypothetical protein